MAGQPLVIVLGGPNGAGKSTAARHLLSEDVTFVNADEIAKTLPTYPSPSADLEAGRLALEQMEGLAGHRADFAVETTLAGRSLASRVRRLQSIGYFFRLCFVWAPNAEYCIKRVEGRVRQGGHDIPEETIRRRYAAGIRNFFELYKPLADVWDVFENTTLSGLRTIAEGGRDRPTTVHDPDLWLLMQEWGKR